MNIKNILIYIVYTYMYCDKVKIKNKVYTWINKYILVYSKKIL